MKITLRELFLIVLFVALALGWWLDRSRLRRENDQLSTAAARLARLLTYHGWKFTSSESELRLQQGELQTTLELSPNYARKIHELATMKVESRFDPLAQPRKVGD